MAIINMIFNFSSLEDTLLKKLINILGLTLFGGSMIWAVFKMFTVTILFLQSPFIPTLSIVGTIVGSLFQAVILMALSLAILYFSKIPNFMNDPENSKKWIFVTLIAFYLCGSCFIFFLYNVYAVPSGSPNILHSFIFLVIFSIIVAFLIYIKKMIEIKLLRSVIGAFLIFALLYGLFAIFIYIFAQPDHNPRLGMATLVFFICLSLIAFQVILFKKIKSEPITGPDRKC